MVSTLVLKICEIQFLGMLLIAFLYAGLSALSTTYKPPGFNLLIVLLIHFERHLPSIIIISNVSSESTTLTYSS